eukprot:9426852-Lingulodinium_polyedra.AAC.1
MIGAIILRSSCVRLFLERPRAEEMRQAQSWPAMRLCPRVLRDNRIAFCIEMDWYDALPGQQSHA